MRFERIRLRTVDGGSALHPRPALIPLVVECQNLDLARVPPRGVPYQAWGELQGLTWAFWWT